MPASRQPGALIDVRGLLDSALESEWGIEVECKSHGAAVQLRQRANSYRVRHRKESYEIYPEGDPRRGVSPYDVLSLEVAKDSNIVKFRKRREDGITFRPLPPPEESDLPPQ